VNPEEKTRVAAGESDQLPPPPPTGPAIGGMPLRRDSDEADEND